MSPLRNVSIENYEETQRIANAIARQKAMRKSTKTATESKGILNMLGTRFRSGTATAEKADSKRRPGTTPWFSKRNVSAEKEELSSQSLEISVSSDCSVVSELTAHTFTDDDEEFEIPCEIDAPQGPALPLTVEQAMIIDRTWKRITSTISSYQQQLGELLILRMITLDPTTRQQLQLFSLRSSGAFTRFTQCTSIAEDVIVSFGSSMREDSESMEQAAYRISQRSRTEGIPLTLLCRAISHSIQSMCKELLFKPNQEEHVAWDKFMNFVAVQMQQNQLQNMANEAKCN